MTNEPGERTDLRLFEGFGIEIEYAIVDRRSLAVRPTADQALQGLAGEPTSDVELGAIAASNELVLHVIELKTNGPSASLDGLSSDFSSAVARVNECLAPLDARLMPTAMHPFMDPMQQTVLWPHDQNDIYRTFDRIFGCKGHGWSNLQSMHINLPFNGDDEFGKLHAAIRLILPLLPALAASSPVVENRLTGLLDNRLEFYRNNARRIPSVAGRVIPERVFSRADYEHQILERIVRDVAPFDPEETLEPEWTNSRGAIARFIRNAIEIRVIDTQECPRADLAIAAVTVAAVRALVEERWCAQADQRRFEVEGLASMFEKALRDGEAAMVNDVDYLRCFGIGDKPIPMGELWTHLAAELIPEGSEHFAPLRHIAGNGCLARRIVERLRDDDSHESVCDVYRELCDCLTDNRLFA